MSHGAPPPPPIDAATDVASSLSGVQRLVTQKRLAEWKLRERVEAAARRRRRSDEEDAEYYREEEDQQESEEDDESDTDALEERTRQRVRRRLGTAGVSHEQHQSGASSAAEVNPLDLLRAAQKESRPAVPLAPGTLVPLDAWSADLSTAALAADASMHDIDWETDEAPPPVTVAATHTDAAHAAPSTSSRHDTEWDANEEVLFGIDEEEDRGAFEEEEEEDAMVDAPPAAAPEPNLNQVTLARSSDATTAAATSVAAQEGVLTISFDAISGDQVAAEVKQRKADAKAQKAQKKQEAAQAKATKTKTKAKGKATKKRKASDDTHDSDAESPKPKLKKKRSSQQREALAPAQRLTKADRDLLTHIHHVHLLSVIALIQNQSSHLPSRGIMTNALLNARILSLAANRCPAARMQHFRLDPRKPATWIGDQGRDSAAAASSTAAAAISKKRQGITWKASHASSSSAASGPSPGDRSEGTIFDRVQKLAYWFRSYFRCSSDRLRPATTIGDTEHPLLGYDANMHSRLLNEVRCTCVRRRIIRAAVRGRGLTDPWRHYRDCLLRQFEHVLETREGGFQHLVMLFVMTLREMGVLTRLCYGIAAVNYRRDLLFPKPADAQQINDAMREGLGSIMGDGDRMQFGEDPNSTAAALVAHMLRQQNVSRQDPRALRVLDSALKEPCQCQKPMQTNASASPTKTTRSANDAAAASFSSSSTNKPHSSPSSSPPAAAAAAAVSSSSTTANPPPSSAASTPRKSTQFLRHEAIEISDSDDDVVATERPTPIKSLHFDDHKSPHFATSAAATKKVPSSQPASSNAVVSAMHDSDFESPAKQPTTSPPPPFPPTRKTTRARKLDVDPPRAPSAASTRGKTAAAAASKPESTSTRTVTPRASRSAKVRYTEPDDPLPNLDTDEDEEAEEDDDDEEESPNPCTVCGANESQDESTNPILLCDGCDAATCLQCVRPHIDEMPDEYFCDKCAKKKKSKKKTTPSQSKKAPTKPTSAAKRRTSAAKDEEEEDDDAEMEEVEKVKSAPRGVSRAKSSSVVGVDLTDSPASSPKSQSRPRLTKAKSTPLSTAKAMTPTKPRQVDDLSALSDSDHEFEPRTPAATSKRAASAAASSAAASSAAASSAAKLPKKQYFEHGYPLVWCEFYCPESKRWIHVDVMRHLFDAEYVYEHDGGITWQYVIAVRPSVPGAPHLLTDVTKRYTRKWSNAAANRVDDGWFLHHLQRLSGPCDAADRDLENADHAELEHRHATHDEMPTRVNEFKSHPLFCIDKFTKKFEMIYPVGQQHSKGIFVEKKKPPADSNQAPTEIVHIVYPRSSLHLLHTVDRWRREQRAVKHEEVPYPVKVVRKLVQMSRAQREDRIQRGLMDPDGEKSELYGIWQTEPWMPDAAQNGVVPKNERGHVDVWGESHIPAGCVHLRYPRLKVVCKKLGIDFADAMTGFDVKGGRSVPRFEGVVVCAEFEDRVMTLYREMERAAGERAEKRRMTAITTNWKRLVRGSIVRTRVMREVMQKADDNREQAFVPADARTHERTPAAAAAAANSTPLAATPYGALATTLHAAAAAATAPLAQDSTHVHAYSQRIFDLKTNAWISVCACGSRQSVEEF